MAVWLAAPAIPWALRDVRPDGGLYGHAFLCPAVFKDREIQGKVAIRLMIICPVAGARKRGSSPCGKASWFDPTNGATSNWPANRNTKRGINE
jgi:hypothetical protein